VAVITKFPQTGKVKTRLMAQLSAEDAARVHRVFATHLVKRLRHLKPLAFKMIVDPPDKLDAMREMLGIEDELLPQCEGDLGARLAHATMQIHEKQSAPVLIFAADSPDLPAAHIHNVAELCTKHDVVLGPSDDGGYWCIGLSSRVDARRLLAGIHWSSGVERAETIARAKKLELTVAEGDMWDDIDRPEDLKRLCERLSDAEDSDSLNLFEQLRFLPKEVLS
jgi:rSAM/selenodomain-associated transferase 1